MPPSDDGASARGRLLLVEDDDDIREALAYLLGERLGVRVDEARDAAQAVPMAEARGGYDVVVSDERMPGMRGSDLLRVLREGNLCGTGILLSAYDSVVAEHAHHVLRKPPDLDRLTAVVAEGLAARP